MTQHSEQCPICREMYEDVRTCGCGYGEAPDIKTDRANQRTEIWRRHSYNLEGDVRELRAENAKLQALYDNEIEASVEHGETIKALHAENAKLREALEKIISSPDSDSGYMHHVARDALQKDEGKVTDLVKRLRHRQSQRDEPNLFGEAADALEAKDAEIERLCRLRHYNAEALWKQNDELTSENAKLREDNEVLQGVANAEAEDHNNALKEIAKLREALEKISQQNPAPDPYGSGLVARAALKLSDAK